jgi:para-nitrobenzyl esterase
MTTRAALGIAGAAVAVSGLVGFGRDVSAVAAAQPACLAAVADGAVQGRDLGAACAFLGIPYAASPAGPNRWRPPQQPVPWSTVLDVTGTAPGTPVPCAQVSFVGQVTQFVGDENCLTLNVWVRNPLPTGGAPVVVWLHPGAFFGASANFAGHRGQTVAAETGVIVVAPNYRLGPFGFLAHDLLAAEDPDGSTGNYGLLDQRAALHWVRDNIHRFGGDPATVTLAGTSAGGNSVGLHLVSPGSHGLFHRAILQSAYPTSRWNDRDEARAQGATFAAGLGCADLGCMRAAPSTAVLTAFLQATQQVHEPPAGRTYWEPSIDGVVLPDQPRTLLEAGVFHRVPAIMGFNRDEGFGAFITRSFSTLTAAQYEAWVATEFGALAPGILDLYAGEAAQSPTEAMARIVGDAQFVCETRRLARAIERTGTRVFAYAYEHEIDALALDHVIHGLEGNILFGNSYVPPVFPSYTLSPVDVAVHHAMAGYWTRFAATGNPNHGNALSPSWPPFTRPAGRGRGTDKHLVLAPQIAERARMRETQCDVFEPHFLRSVLSSLPAAAP